MSKTDAMTVSAEEPPPLRNVTVREWMVASIAIASFLWTAVTQVQAQGGIQGRAAAQLEMMERRVNRAEDTSQVLRDSMADIRADMKEVKLRFGDVAWMKQWIQSSEKQAVK